MSTTTRATEDAAVLLERFGDTVQRIAEGKGVPLNVTAIIDPNKEVKQQERGTEFVTLLDIEVADDQAVDRRDQWVIYDRVFHVERLSHPEAGLRTIHLIDTLKRGTTSANRQ